MQLLHRFVRWCPGALGYILRQKYYPRILGSCGKKVIFGRFLTFHAPENISIGNNVILSNDVQITAESRVSEKEQIIIKDSVFVGTYSHLTVENGGEIILDEGTNISSCCHLHSSSLLKIGKHCLFAAYCNLGLPREKLSSENRNITVDTLIGDACWVGVRVQQFMGTSVGKESIVGAHAVVETNIPAFSIAVGQPAEVQRQR